ncbi:hypothetical protein [Flavivirga jejuensis]|uniref:Uncharacterized protein n=1 Tax=Flavivirga jejuensis TaxID=870487 RepID=A0ABT8WV51_9FLAO|nr:hypothetical protein [Flavivirga jejuensis]MDO5976869.1 hypothetical protein [Flavivirga jejuensis]
MKKAKNLYAYLILCLILLVSCGGNSDDSEEEVIDLNEPVTWTGTVTSDGTDLWLVLNGNGEPYYDFRIGTGGAMSEIRDLTESSENLLSPSYNGEQTDRIIQWTLWSINGDIKNTEDLELLNKQRYNVTQGGTGINQLSEIISVTVNAEKNQVDVYSNPKLQWQEENQNAMTGTHAALTRYTIQTNGSIKIYRAVSVAEPKLNGVAQQWSDFYFEGWTPMLGGSSAFDGLALSLNSSGAPDLWYQWLSGIPSYPFLEASTTEGYAIAYNTSKYSTKDAVGVVYGKGNVETSGTAKHVLNLLPWNTGIGILPAIKSESVIPAHSLVEQTLYIVPRQGLTEAMKTELDDMVNEISAPKIYTPSEIPSGSELETIYATLMANRLLSGTATDNLSALAPID